MSPGEEMLRKLRFLGKFAPSVLIAWMVMYSVITGLREAHSIPAWGRLVSVILVTMIAFIWMYYLVIPSTARGIKAFFTYVKTRPYEASLIGTGAGTTLIGIVGILIIR